MHPGAGESDRWWVLPVEHWRPEGSTEPQNLQPPEERGGLQNLRTDAL
jgi:hypothetical protein